MRSISAKQFKEFVNDDPAWANKLKGPVEIRTYANMDNSGITHLSPFLLFSGRDNEGNVASFRGCTKLKKAEGNFDGFVDFGVNYDEIELNLEAQGGNQDNIDILDDNTEEPNKPQNTRSNQNTPQNEEREDLIDIPYACPVGIEEIGDFKILRPNNKGDAVDFSGAIELKVYRGSYPGHINIGHNDLLRWTREMSGGAEREKIRLENLEVTGENNKGLACTINNSLVNRLEGHYSSAIRLVGTEVAKFGSPRLDPKKRETGELDITPNLAGTKIELKNNSYPSTIKVIGFAKEFPFEAHELDLPRASTKKNGDPLTELRDMLKIKKAMLTKEDPKNSKDPWHKQIKRTAVRTIAQCLQADDILKKEGHLASSKNRLSKILKASAVIATIIASFGYNTLQEIGKEIKENVIIEPTAAQLQDYAYSKGLSKDIIKNLPVTTSLKEVARGSKENNETDQPKDKEGNPLEIIINKEGKTIQLTNSNINNSNCPKEHICCPEHLNPKEQKGELPRGVETKKAKSNKKTKYFGDDSIGLASL